MASGDERMGSLGNCAPYGSEVFCVGPLLQADALNFRIPVPTGMGAIKVKSVKSFLNVVLATANSVVTVKKQHASESAVSMTGGTLTITSTGTVGDEDSCDITDDANARVPAGDFIVLAVDGGASAGEAVFFVEYERVQ